MMGNYQQSINNDLLFPITKRQNQGVIPLSFAQQRIWFLEQLQQENTGDNFSCILYIQGSLDVVILKKSITEIIKRHEILRTKFLIIKGQVTQIIDDHIDFSLPIIDLSSIPQEKILIEGLSIAEQEAQEPLNLVNNFLFQVKLLRLNQNSNILLFKVHPIIFDSYSFDLLFKELNLLYTAYSEGLNSPLKPFSIQYADFSSWQRNCLTEKVLESQISYWKQQLGGTLPRLELASDRPRPRVQTNKTLTKSFTIPQVLTTSIKSLAEEEGVSVFIILLSVFKIFLSRYSRQKDIIIGTPVTERQSQETKDLIGLFVNILPIRSNLTNCHTFRNFLNQIKTVCLEAYTHQDIPFEQLIQILQPKRDLSYHPIFQVMFDLKEQSIQEPQLNNLTISIIKKLEPAYNLDLTLLMEENDGKLIGKWQYNSDLFDESKIQKMSEHFEILLSEIIAKPDKNFWKLPLISEEEKNQLLFQWNQKEANYPQDQCIHQLFEQQVSKNPDAIAVRFENQKLTYRELNQSSNQLANYLKKIGVNTEEVIGLCLEPSLTRIIGLLAILKAGGVYLPLDSGYPQERLKFMIEDSNVSIILTQESLNAKLSINSLQLINLDSNWETISQESSHNLKTEIAPKNLANIIYTSGSTGKPKGVLICHQGLSNLVTDHIQLFQVKPSSRVLQFSSLSFDASMWEIFLALASGACLCSGTFESLLPGKNLLNFFQEKQITHVMLVPSALANLPHTNLPQLKVILAAGETCRGDLVKTWSVGRKLFNAYGPTESTILTTVFDCQGIKDNRIPPIGRPVANTKVYILDDNLQLVPIGVPGELHISSVGLARGYLNREELTQKKFIPNPFGEGKLYKTGDLVYYLPDGNIQFLGRIDKQVKIRGFRIELGEIEAQLNQHPNIQEAKVTTTEKIAGQKLLVAYVILNANISSSSDTAHQLREYLKTKLPDYMIPSAFVVLESFPITPNGKIDYRGFPTPDFSSLQNEYIAPRTATEAILANIWGQVLQLNNIGIRDNFLELGGNSLLAVHLLAEIEKVFAKQLPLAALYNFPTVEELATLISQEAKNYDWEAIKSIIPIQPKGSKPPLFFIHMLGRGLDVCRPIISYLSPDQPIYGLNAQTTAKKLYFFNGVEDLATHYIMQMQRLQPKGPYFLAGISFGGTVAYEMAQQLLSQGETVALLALFDTLAPDAIQKLPINEQIQLHWSNFVEQGFSYLLDNSIQIIKGKSYKNRKRLKQQLSKMYLPFALRLNLPLSDEMQYLIFQQENVEALKKYTPKIYPGNLTLFIAQDRQFSPSYSIDPQLGWGKLVDGELTIYETPGTHIGMLLQESSAKILAEQLTLAMETSTQKTVEEQGVRSREKI
ncbi:MAG: amino acid adenylation domain-containing protein [Crocosphaera sp.]|nr:amino acid adenylation domain-containing protein [Crocosphaera sp.]